MTDYRRKKRNLNKVDYTNKTKNQSRRYLINQFKSLGINSPSYVNNPTPGNIKKALKRINKELDKIIEKQKIESAERKALNRDTDRKLSMALKSYNTQVTKTLNQIKSYSIFQMDRKLYNYCFLLELHKYFHLNPFSYRSRCILSICL